MESAHVIGSSDPVNLAEYKRYVASLSRLKVNLSDFVEVLEFHRQVAGALLGVGAPAVKIREYTADANRWANIIDDLLKRRPELVIPLPAPTGEAREALQPPTGEAA